MKKLSVRVGSVTYALKAKQVLQQNGISASVRKTPSAKSNEGCGYAVVVERTPENVGAILQRAGIACKEMKWME